MTREEAIKIIIVQDEKGNIKQIFTNLRDIYDIEIEVFDEKGTTEIERVDKEIELKTKYREIKRTVL